MVEVTKFNFAKLLPSITKSITECDFIAIDTEFTGLYNTRPMEHAFDTMEDRYAKNKEQCSKFLIIQFGLSTFKYDADKNKYYHSDFNCYVFPRPHMRQAPDPRFLCQTSSLHFLASHGFDFNKVIYEGIPYLTLEQENNIKEHLFSKHKKGRDSFISAKSSPTANGQKLAEVQIPDDHKDFIAEINERVDAFIADETAIIMQLEPCSSYRRKLIYETVQQKHSSGIEMSSKMNEDNQRFITIMKCSEEDKLDKLKTSEINDFDELEAAVGFRRVIDCISESKKLILGQCMQLDLMHIIEQFFCPLPETLKEYKEMIRSIFPHILDTKFLSSSDKLKPFIMPSHLSDLLKQLQGKAFGLPVIEKPDAFINAYDINSDRNHEAGFDAFMAGVCFLGMARKLGSLSNPPVLHVAPDAKLLSRYVNRLYVRQHYDVTCLNLNGPDPEPNRDNVFYVSFPEEWKTVDLVELFLPFGNIYVSWLDNVSALVSLKSPENTISAKAKLVNKPSRIYRVKPYSEYLKWEKAQLAPNKDSAQKRSQCSEDKPIPTKKRNSADGSGSSSLSSSLDQIIEADENEAEIAERSGLPPPKKSRLVDEEMDASEVSSTAKVFDEDNAW